MFRAIQFSMLALTIFLGIAGSRSQDVKYNLSADRPICFTQNMGQWDSRVLFRARVRGAIVWITREGIYSQFIRIDPSSSRSDTSETRRFMLPKYPKALQCVEQTIIKSSFVGAHTGMVANGVERQEFNCNFFLGDDPSAWRADVPNYGRVVIGDLYQGVDLTLYGNADDYLEFDLIVQPRADYRQIRLRYEGAVAVSLCEVGGMKIETAWHTIILQKPIIYQEIKGERHFIHGEFEMLTEGDFTFALGADYDPGYCVVIDPTMVYGTYLAGTSFDEPNAIAVDAEGAAYVTGRTYSGDFLSVGTLQAMAPPKDIFVTKLSSDGGAIQYSTFLGGTTSGGGDGEDEAYGIAVDNLGRAYIAGITECVDFPKVNNLFSYSDSYSPIIARLSSTGNALEYSGYLGPEGGATSIDVDRNGCAYVAGVTGSNDFPTKDPFQTAPPDDWRSDGFLLKLNPDGSELIFGTYFGANDRDGILGVALGGSGRIAVCGSTNSTDFPLKRPIITSVDGHFGEDGFIAEFAPNGDSLIYSTIVGADGLDAAYEVDIDSAGCSYVVGRTNSDHFPVKGSFLPFYSGDNGFLSKISPNGDLLVLSTYIGGSAHDETYDVVIANECAVAVGQTFSTDFPKKNPFQYLAAGFVMKFASSGDSLIYSTPFVTGDTRIYGVAADSGGALYVAGQTNTMNMMLLNPVQTAQGQYDGFAAKLKDEFICADVDADQSVELRDIVYLINYIFAGGYQPNPIVAADVDCNGIVTISDAVYLINYVFSGGPAPCSSCP